MLSLEEIKAALPDGGLFGGADGQGWLLSPEPLKISKKEAKTIGRLGRVLDRFQAACERLYRRSAKGDWEPWLAELMDAGKPEWMVAAQRSGVIADERPRVIRPDLLLKEGGLFGISELDAVPGGMGMTAWLNETYAEAGFEVWGGREGMKKGFASLFPEGGGQVLISEESGDYRLEIENLSEGLSGIEVQSAEAFSGKTESENSALYRFFELFDWENIPAAKELAMSAQLAPPFKPIFEEKLWLVLLWCPALREVWKDELRGVHLDSLRELVPFGWVVDPTELPPHAALPELGLRSWKEVGQLSQKERRLVLKISGFSERAWGSRGVVVGHDLPGDEWAAAIDSAVEEFPTNPWVMQKFVEARVVEHPYYDRESGEQEMMKGRVRLCPYYFRSREDDEIVAGGCLATIAPVDKKKIHGMADAILVPVCVEE